MRAFDRRAPVLILVAGVALASCGGGGDDGGGSPLPPRYTATRLAQFESTNNTFNLRSLNSAGDVGGVNNGVPFLYWRGAIELLGIPPGMGSGHVSAVNDAKQATIDAEQGPQIGRVFQSYLYANGAMQALPGFAFARAINARGDVAGLARIARSGGSALTGALYSGGAVIDLVPDGTAAATALNDRAEVVGSYTRDSDARARAFLFSNGKVSDLGFYGVANDINNKGDIVGTIDVNGSGTTHAFRYTGGQVHDLGTFGGTSSVASYVDAAGRIGGYIDPYGGTSRTFLYADKMYELKSLVDGVASEDLPIGTIGIIDMSESGKMLVQLCAVDCKGFHTYLLTPQ